jgi:hypothetical protein
MPANLKRRYYSDVFGFKPLWGSASFFLPDLIQNYVHFAKSDLSCFEDIYKFFGWEKISYKNK